MGWEGKGSNLKEERQGQGSNDNPGDTVREMAEFRSEILVKSRDKTLVSSHRLPEVCTKSTTTDVH
jgi:hypothetical protein